MVTTESKRDLGLGWVGQNCCSDLEITDCGVALDLLCPLDCDFPLGIHLPDHT